MPIIQRKIITSSKPSQNSKRFIKVEDKRCNNGWVKRIDLDRAMVFIM